MKRISISLLWMVFTVTPFGAFAQGKVAFVNDSLHLVYFTADSARLNAGDAALAGIGPSVGTVYADPQTVLVGNLYFGTSSNTVTTLALDGLGSPYTVYLTNVTAGRFGPVTVILPSGNPSGTTNWFQVQIHDSRDASEAASAAARGHYFGHSILFSAPLGSITPTSIVNPIKSTWTNGTFDMSATWGPGALGAIELSTTDGRPRITNQPVSLTVTQGLSAAFSASASGLPPLHYQWQLNGADLAEGGNVLGSATNTLNLSTTSVSDAGSYAVVITNSYGSVTSAVATLTVLEAPVITIQPLSQTVFAGSNVTFSVAVTAYPPVTYQWAYNNFRLPGATGPSLVLTNVQLSRAGIYTVAVTNSMGFAVSTQATLTVLSAPQILSQPGNQVGYWGFNVSFQAGVQGTAPISYQWYFNGSAIADGTNATLALSDLAMTAAGQYWVVISNAYGTVTSDTATLIVNPAGISLDVYPGLTITGAVGKSFDVQYVYFGGDTNTWTTVTNITLTVPSRLWIDTSAGAAAGISPNRFYRLKATP
jgi:hypothetical protein